MTQWRKALEANPLEKEYKMRSGQIFSTNSVVGSLNDREEISVSRYLNCEIAKNIFRIA